MYRSIMNFFDKFEDHVRARLSKFPIWYAIIGGVCVVLFWRGVWHTADILQAEGGILGFIFYEPINMLIALAILLATGLFVSFFVGDTILIAGLKREKKITEQTETEVKEESDKINSLRTEMKKIKEELDMVHKDVDEIRDGKK